MSSGDHDRAGRDRLMATWVELAIRLGVLGLLVFLAFTLVRPFITIAIWSVVLTVALYPVYDWMVGRLGGRRRLAAGLITILNLLIVIGPATWLTLGLIDSLRNLSEHFDLSALALPPPPEAVKTWPVIGDTIYQFWDLASTNFRAALDKMAPLLKPVGGILLGIAEGAGTGIIKFFIAIVISGFLFSPAPPWLMQSYCCRTGSLRGAAKSSCNSPEPPSALFHVASLAFLLCKRCLQDWASWSLEFQALA